ncbi:CRISPR-associated protein Cas5 [Runella sp.]|uniref:CRISPR-associated protein Cas5 n=1 Tax=Runella sp. TaxID=1960881 RepID=UPI00260D920D|nr:CRISPR-associated protein Cas5 [Runella sp.]
MKELISFDWCGKMAHFRKFYSNASALTHTIPPRTTVLGLLASIAEIERDSYYFGTENEAFNSLKIGIQIINPVRKINQKFNYLKIVKDGASEESLASDINDLYIFRGYGNRKQISTEIIIPHSIRDKDALVKYRIFVGFPESDEPVFTKLKANLTREYYPFGVCLGAANMLGFIAQPNGIEPIDYEVGLQSKDFVEVIGAIEEGLVSEIDRGHNFSIEHDLFPTSFTHNKELKGRIANETKVFLYSADKSSLRLKLHSSESLFFFPKQEQYIYLL